MRITASVRGTAEAEGTAGAATTGEGVATASLGGRRDEPNMGEIEPSAALLSGSASSDVRITTAAEESSADAGKICKRASQDSTFVRRGGPEALGGEVQVFTSTL